MIEKSFTQEEFDTFVREHDVEVYKSTAVSSWVDSLMQIQDGLLQDELIAAKAEFDCLTPVNVVNSDLTKSLYYIRPSQVEDRTFLETTADGVEKSMTLKVFRDTPLNRFRGVVGIAVNDVDSIEKSVAEAVGVKKKYADGRVYQKTESGWKPLAENKKRPEKTQLNTAGRDQKKSLKERIIESVKRMSDGQLKIFLKNKDISGLRRSELEKEARKRGITN